MDTQGAADSQMQDAQDQLVHQPRDSFKKPLRKKEELLRNQRKAALNKHGVIPEYIKIQETYQVYTAFTQANLKNSILNQKKAYK